MSLVAELKSRFIHNLFPRQRCYGQGLTGSRYPTRPEVKNPYPSGPSYGEGPSELVGLMDSQKIIVC